MALSFSPGSYGTLYDYGTFQAQYKWGDWETSSTNAWGPREMTYRPWPPKGEVVKLGDTIFRKSTNFRRDGWKLEDYSPCSIQGRWGHSPHPDAVFSVSNDTLEIPGWAETAGTSAFIGNEDWDALRNEAVTKALNKIADQKVNIGENLATIRQTYGMFLSKGLILGKMLNSGMKNKSLIPFFKDSYRDLKRANIPKVIAGQYLEYVYGLKPLMQDIWELTQMMQGKLITSPMILKSYGKATRGKNLGISDWRYSSASKSRRTRMEYQATAKCTLWASLNPESQGLRALNQLGLANPLSLMWELQPLSFVVDWFCPVGQVISALSARTGLDWIDGSISYKMVQGSEHEYATERYLINMDTWGVENAQVGTFRVTKEYWQRDKLSDWPMPGFWTTEDPFSGDRGAKALALLVSNLAFRSNALRRERILDGRILYSRIGQEYRSGA